MYKYLFGPVPSRRLGVSLGVDLVTHKICSLDCVYCECGSTTELTCERKEYVPCGEVIKELKHYLAGNPPPDFITFSGSGEPTLNSGIGDVIRFIKSQKYPDGDISVAVLTNGTLLGDRDVRESLLMADLVMPSLDAATLKAFRSINRPHDSISLSGYIDGIAEFRKIYRGKLALEVLILPGFNDSREDLIKLKEACLKIDPDTVQLNTLDRPGAIREISPATRESLEEIKSFLEKDESVMRDENSEELKKAKNSAEEYRGKKSLNVEIIASSAPRRKEISSYRSDLESGLESAIMETIHRRPCTPEDLASILGSHLNEIQKYLSDMENAGRIVSVPQQRGIFYHSKK